MTGLRQYHRMPWHQKNLSGPVYDVVLTSVCKTHEMRAWTERKQGKEDLGKTLSQGLREVPPEGSYCKPQSGP